MYSSITRVNRVGSVTPNWIKAQKKLKPTNAYNFSKTVLNCYRESWYGESLDTNGRLKSSADRNGYLNTSPSESVAGDIWYNPQVLVMPQSESDAALSRVITKVLNEVKDQKVNIQQFIAERDQTIHLLTETVKSITGLVKNLKRGNFPAAFKSVGVHLSKSKRKKLSRGFARDQSKAIANGWIAVQYGVKPLLDDVKGAAESLAKALNQQPPIHRASASVTVKHNVMTSGIVNPNFPRSYTNVSEVSQTHKYVIYCRPSLNVSSFPTSLGLTNPLSIAWELTPWSFVVDWFYPIGNFLSSLDATVGVDFVSGSYTVFTKTKALRNINWNIPGSAANRGFGSSSYESVVMKRQILIAFPRPSLPAFKNPASSTHMMNALALLRQQFR